MNHDEPISTEGYRNAMSVSHALTLTSVQVGYLLDRIERLSHTVRKLSGHAGWDISELIVEGLLEEGDLS